MIHRLAHLFGLFHGQCYSWWDGDKLMMGFKCSKCGDISGVYDVTNLCPSDRKDG